MSSCSSSSRVRSKWSAVCDPISQPTSISRSISLQSSDLSSARGASSPGHLSGSPESTKRVATNTVAGQPNRLEKRQTTEDGCKAIVERDDDRARRQAAVLLPLLRIGECEPCVAAIPQERQMAGELGLPDGKPMAPAVADRVVGKDEGWRHQGIRARRRSGTPR
jgi:hypothetical protein